VRTHVISSRLLLIFCFSLCCLLAACGHSTSSTGSTQGSSTGATPTPTTAVDAYGSPIVIPKTAPQRIVSLAPSMSEILGALHLQNKVVGVDYNTDYPAALAGVKKVSNIDGIYNVEEIDALHPDLVLSSGGITKTYDAQMTRLGLHVVDLPPASFAQVLDQILLVGRLTYMQSTAQTVVAQIQQQITAVEVAVKGTPSTPVMLEVDDSTPGKPYVFGGGSFGDDIVRDANATNIFHSDTSNEGYPQVTDEAVIAANPQYIVLTEDPAYGGDPNLVYKRPNWAGIAAVKQHHVYHLNADIMQRPGPRLGDALRCLAQIVHPDKFSGSLPVYCSKNV
jgi:iron complex transport system substrate-binding protein